jgi:hypothetical protein
MTYQMHKTYIDSILGKLSKDSGLDPSEAFLRFCYSSLFNRAFNEVDEEDIVDASGDKQIDVIKIDESDDESAKISIIQSKYTSGFSSTALIKLNNGLSWVFEKSEKDYSLIENTPLIAKIKEIRELIDDKLPSNIEIDVYFITVGDKHDLSGEFVQELNSLEEKWSPAGFASFNFHIWGASELASYINDAESTKKLIKQKIKIEYDVNVPSLIETNISDFKGVICSVRASEIARLIDEDIHGVIFNKNIRKFLGTKKKINRSIYDSCTDREDSQMFWFLNNGVTIVCDSFSVIRNPDNPQIDITNLQIVNGCQTSVTLCNAMRDGKLKPDARLLVKIYSTEGEDEDFVGKITLSTNNQNKIGLRDLKSNDHVQQDLQRALLVKYGYFYERKFNEFKDDKKKNEKRIVNERLAQAYLAIGKKKPSVARSRPNYIWGDEAYYDLVFRKSTLSQLVFCYKIFEYCNNVKKVKMRSYAADEKLYSLVSYGALHVARVLASLFLKNESLPNDDVLDECIAKIEYNQKILENSYESSIKILNDLLEENRSKYTSVVSFLKTNEVQRAINKKLKRVMLKDSK